MSMLAVFALSAVMAWLDGSVSVVVVLTGYLVLKGLVLLVSMERLDLNGPVTTRADSVWLFGLSLLNFFMGLFPPMAFLFGLLMFSKILFWNLSFFLLTSKDLFDFLGNDVFESFGNGFLLL